MAGIRNVKSDWWADLAGEIDRSTRKRFQTLGRESIVAKGVAVIDEGDRADRFSLVIEGSADVEIDGRVVASLGAGDFFGEVAMLYTQPPGSGSAATLRRTATVRATQTSRVRQFDRAELLTLMDLAPHAASRISRQAIGRLAVLNQSVAVG